MRTIVLSLALLLASANALWAIEIEVGDRIELKATSPLGVPLHSEPRPGMVGRADDGSLAEVTSLETGNWLGIDLDDGREGFIVRKYVARVLPAPDPGDGEPPDDLVDPSLDENEVWSSISRCETVVNDGRRMAPRQDDVLRLATWNVRWFPDGIPGENVVPDRPTDRAWMACALTWMNADVIAVQEFKRHRSAQDALDEVLDGLNGFTGDAWQAAFQSCGHEANQHVGLIWNTARVSVGDFRDLWQLNGRAGNATQACLDNLRPGFAARVAPAEGHGADFHIVTVHLDAGERDKDFATRDTAYNRVDQAVAGLVPQDEDVVLLGDFNAAGDDQPPGLTSQEEEIADMASILAGEGPGFRRFEAEPRCTHYFERDPGWLDHVFASAGMAEAFELRARVTGYCALEGCNGRLSGELPASMLDLSDHCPVVVDIRNEDED